MRCNSRGFEFGVACPNIIKTCMRMWVSTGRFSNSVSPALLPGPYVNVVPEVAINLGFPNVPDSAILFEISFGGLCAMFSAPKKNRTGATRSVTATGILTPMAILVLLDSPQEFSKSLSGAACDHIHQTHT